MAKGQKRSNREKKKPKRDKKKVTPAASPFASSDQRGKLGGSSVPKKDLLHSAARFDPRARSDLLMLRYWPGAVGGFSDSVGCTCDLASFSLVLSSSRSALACSSSVLSLSASR